MQTHESKVPSKAQQLLSAYDHQDALARKPSAVATRPHQVWSCRCCCRCCVLGCLEVAYRGVSGCVVCLVKKAEGALRGLMMSVWVLRGCVVAMRLKRGLPLSMMMMAPALFALLLWVGLTAMIGGDKPAQSVASQRSCMTSPRSEVAQNRRNSNMAAGAPQNATMHTHKFQ